VYNIVDLITKGIKLKHWKRTLYACSGILEVGPNAIKYIIDCKDNVKKMPRLHRMSDAKYDKSGMVLLNHDCKKKRKSKKNERPF